MTHFKRLKIYIVDATLPDMAVQTYVDDESFEVVFEHIDRKARWCILAKGPEAAIRHALGDHYEYLEGVRRITNPGLARALINGYTGDDDE